MRSFSGCLAASPVKNTRGRRHRRPCTCNLAGCNSVKNSRECCIYLYAMISEIKSKLTVPQQTLQYWPSYAPGRWQLSSHAIATPLNTSAAENSRRSNIACLLACLLACLVLPAVLYMISPLESILVYASAICTSCSACRKGGVSKR